MEHVMGGIDWINRQHCKHRDLPIYDYAFNFRKFHRTSILYLQYDTAAAANIDVGNFVSEIRRIIIGSALRPATTIGNERL